jgi:hypothetical protein
MAIHAGSQRSRTEEASAPPRIPAASGPPPEILASRGPGREQAAEPPHGDDAILCALVAREWRWRGCSVAGDALGRSSEPQIWRLRDSSRGVWLDDAQAARALRELEYRIEDAERAVRALRTAFAAVPPPRLADPLGTPHRASCLRRLRVAQDSYASALARLGSADHPECLRGEARLLEAQIVAWEHHSPSLPDGSPWPDQRDALRLVALRRRWEAAERSNRASPDQRALAFRALAEAAHA